MRWKEFKSFDQLQRALEREEQLIEEKERRKRRAEREARRAEARRAAGYKKKKYVRIDGIEWSIDLLKAMGQYTEEE